MKPANLSEEACKVLDSDEHALIYVGRDPADPDVVVGGARPDRILERDLHEFGHAMGELFWKICDTMEQREKLVAGILCYLVSRRAAERMFPSLSDFKLPKGEA